MPIIQLTNLPILDEELRADYQRTMKRIIWEKIIENSRDKDKLLLVADDHIDAVLKSLDMEIVFK